MDFSNIIRKRLSGVAYKWDEVEELLGSHEMLENIWRYLSEDDIIKILGWFNEDFDIWVDDEDIE